MVKNSSPDELALRELISRGTVLMAQLQNGSSFLIEGVSFVLPVNIL